MPWPKRKSSSGLGCSEWGRIRYQDGDSLVLEAGGEASCPMAIPFRGATAD